MDFIKEGLDKLVSINIPFNVACSSNNSECIVNLNENDKDELRTQGFRVGKQMVNGKRVVYYKGRFFGITTG
jgi:hypothetical protein